MKYLVSFCIVLFFSVSCSQQKTLIAENQVLLDSDLDGIHDDRDVCPNQPGSPFNLGCPLENILTTNFDKIASTDSDLDGISNDKDECPEVSGSPFNLGCPINN